MTRRPALLARQALTDTTVTATLVDAALHALDLGLAGFGCAKFGVPGTVGSGPGTDQNPKEVLMLNESTLTASRLREVLNYDPLTGVFRWRKTIGAKAQKGCVAGYVKRGYRIICVDRNQHPAHRLAWLYVYGVWPAREVDHHNENKSDNRLINLREVTRAENMHNVGIRSTNTSGYLGVSFNKGYWRAEIRADGKRHCIGWFKSPEAAGAAYLEAKARFHPTWQQGENTQ